ncbi:hypothetical protein ACTFIV_010346 [Dictyostelium citrinum]
MSLGDDANATMADCHSMVQLSGIDGYCDGGSAASVSETASISPVFSVSHASSPANSASIDQLTFESVNIVPEFNYFSIPSTLANANKIKIRRSSARKKKTECHSCGNTTTTYWRRCTYNGVVYDLCNPCGLQFKKISK